MSQDYQLKESVLKNSFKNFDHTELIAHFKEVSADTQTLEGFFPIFRRASGMIIEHHDTEKEGKRDAFMDALSKYFESVDDELFLKFKIQRDEFNKLESVYRTIIDHLAKCEISKLSPELRMSAHIYRAAEQVKIFYDRFIADLAKETRASPSYSGPYLKDEKGNEISIDAVNSAIVQSLSSTLQLESYRNKWFENEIIKIPPLVATDDDARFKAGSYEFLSMYWHRWKNIETRFRYLDGKLEPVNKETLSASDELQRFNIINKYNPGNLELYDFISCERFFDQLMQNYREMSFEPACQQRIKGLESSIEPMPSEYISLEEMHAHYSLAGILNYDILNCSGQPKGLRLVEWIRGFAILKEFARSKIATIRGFEDFVLQVSRKDLIELLAKSKFSTEKCELFIQAITNRKGSADLFDCPLIQTKEDNFVIFAPSVSYSNLPRTVMSSLGSERNQLGDKGKGFEKSFLAFLQERGLQSKTIEAKRKREQYQYDVIMVWGDYIFVIECKNYNLSFHSPTEIYNFHLKMSSAQSQVLRLAQALEEFPDILESNFGINLKNTPMKIIPIVLNALPYSLPGPKDGVYFSDAFSLMRFFEEKDFSLTEVVRFENGQLLNRKHPVYSQWKGDEPNVSDLIQHLNNPYQIRLAKGHLGIFSSGFHLDSQEVWLVGELGRKEMTNESFTKFSGSSWENIEQKMKETSREVEALKTGGVKTQSKLFS